MISFIETKNFKKLGTSRLDFTTETNLVIGENGKGKTTVFNALRFALYGTSAIASSALNIPTWGNKNCEVSVGFTNDFLIVRSLKDCKVYRAGNDGSLLNLPERKVAEGSKPCTEWVKSHLGLDYKMFSIFNMSMQGETGALITLGATELNRIVESFSGIGILDKIIKSLSKEKGLIEGALTTVEYYDINERNALFKQKEIEQSKISKLAESTNLRLISLTEKEKIALQAYQSAVIENQKITEIETDLAVKTEALTTLKENLLSSDKKVNDLKNKVELTNTDNIANLTLVSNLENEVKLFNTDSTLHTQYEMQANKLSAELLEHKKNAELEDSVEVAKQALLKEISIGENTKLIISSIVSLKSRLSSLEEDRVSALKMSVLELDVDVKKKALNKEISILEEKHLILNEAYLSSKAAYTKAQKVVTSGVCEACLRPFENFNESKAIINEVNAKNKLYLDSKAFSQLNNEIVLAKDKLSNLPNYGKDNLLHANNLLPDISSYKSRLEKELSTLEVVSEKELSTWEVISEKDIAKEEASLQSLRKSLSELPNPGINNFKKVKECENYLAELTIKIGDLESAWEKFNEEETLSTIKTCKLAIQEFNNVVRDLDFHISERNITETKVERLALVLAKIEVKEKQDLDSLSLQCKQITAETETTRSALTAITGALTKLTIELKLEGSELDRIKESNALYNKYTNILDKTNRLTKFLRKSRANYMDGVWILILSAASSWVSQATSGWEAAISEVSRNANGDFTFTENGITSPVYSEASGAQKEFIGVALRIGLSMALQGKSALLMLDEPTAGMSEVNADRLATALLSVAGQKIIITHRKSERLTANNIINL